MLADSFRLRHPSSERDGQAKAKATLLPRRRGRPDEASPHATHAAESRTIRTEHNVDEIRTEHDVRLDASRLPRTATPASARSIFAASPPWSPPRALRSLVSAQLAAEVVREFRDVEGRVFNSSGARPPVRRPGVPRVRARRSFPGGSRGGVPPDAARVTPLPSSSGQNFSANPSNFAATSAVAELRRAPLRGGASPRLH